MLLASRPAEPHRPTYRPEIDGLRAIAVVAVVLYHTRLGVPGGFVGVDVFFVISGYLITLLLRAELAGGGIDLKAFWERRLRRILPALVVVTLVSLGVGWWVLLPSDYRDLGGAVSALVVLGANFYYWQHADYFAPGTEGMALLHTWSLAVEEQFYLLFPLVVAGLARLRTRRATRLVIAFGVVAFAVSVEGVAHASRAAFFLLPGRAWELALGAMVAARPRRTPWPKWLGEGLSATGLALIVAACFCYRESTRTPGWAALPPCLGAALVIHATAGGTTLAGRVLAWRPAVWVGLISYSWYLWHWPVWIFGCYLCLDPLRWPARAGLVVLSAILATLSWRYVETPFRRRRWCPDRAGLFRWAAISGALLLTAGLTLARLQGVPQRVPAAANAYHRAQTDFVDTYGRQIGLAEARDGDFIAAGSNQADAPTDLFVWGDSHAAAILPAINAVARQHGLKVLAATHPGTPPLVAYIPENDYGLGRDAPPTAELVVSYIRSHHIRRVVLVARWDFYAAGLAPEFHEALRKTLAALRAAGARVWIVSEVPTFDWDVPRALAITTWLGRDTAHLGLPAARYHDLLANQEREFFAAAGPDIHLLEPWKYLIRGADAPVVIDGTVVYRDADHFTTQGAMRLTPMFEAMLAQ